MHNHACLIDGMSVKHSMQQHQNGFCGCSLCETQVQRLSIATTLFGAHRQAAISALAWWVLAARSCLAALHAVHRC
jgi:hypothetical protein